MSAPPASASISVHEKMWGRAARITIMHSDLVRLAEILGADPLSAELADPLELSAFILFHASAVAVALVVKGIPALLYVSAVAVVCLLRCALAGLAALALAAILRPLMWALGIPPSYS
ncbi:MAG: hypothetical protein KF715_05005 [Candidatus Didemnitutus sp.]|nr:hypothetical protein [Candidatus Didemnitutus sp.]